MRAKSAWTVTFVLGLCLVVLVVGVPLSEDAGRQGYFNADHIYIATLYRDLTHWGGQITDWNFTPAPYFFPDMLLYGIGRILTPTVEVSQYATDLLQLLLVICAARALLRRALPDYALETALVAPFFAGWVLLHSYEGYAFIGPAMEIAGHGGGLLSSLVVFTLCLRPQRRLRASGAVAVAILSALTAASDALFVVSCSLPLAATALWYAPNAIHARIHGVPKALPVLLGRCAVGAIFGVGGLLLARAAGLVHADIGGGSLELAGATWPHIWYGSDKDAKYAVIGLACAALLALIVIAFTWRNPQRGGFRVLAFWQLSVSGAVFGAYLYDGAHLDRWTLRYLVTPCNLGLIFIVALCARGIGSARASASPNPWPTRVAALATIVAVVSFATQASALMSFRTRAPQRAAAECVANVAQQEGVTAILGEYWIAKPVTLLSDNRAHVVQVTPSLRPNLWISSRGWSRGSHTYGMVITNGLDIPTLTKVFGSPQVTTRCGDYEVYIYEGMSRVNMAFRMHYAFDKEVAASDEDRKMGW